MADFIETAITVFKGNPAVRFWVGIVFAVIAVIMIGVFGGMIGATHTAPSAPTGWGGRDYDADQNTRGSLQDMITAGVGGITNDTKITELSVATANYGGIFTESIGLLNPWIGRVDPDAVRLQIEAGARAVVFDIWPDPENPAIPVVCAMKDVSQWGVLSWWRGHGLDKGVGQYSNWQLLTRNKVAASDMITAACKAAFESLAPNVQTSDPFFLILRLHGAMTVNYLNYLGDVIKGALGHRRIETQWDAMKNQDALCSAKVSQFKEKAFVIVSPDIQSGYNSLPNTNTWDSFRTQYLTTRMAEVTNVLESAANTVFVGTGNLDALGAATLPACGGAGSTGPAQTPVQAGFCVVQPSVGGQSTDNDTQIGLSTFQKARQMGAQFVAVNYFSPNAGDKVLGAVFDPALFGKYSFKKGA